MLTPTVGHRWGHDLEYKYEYDPSAGKGVDVYVLGMSALYILLHARTWYIFWIRFLLALDSGESFKNHILTVDKRLTLFNFPLGRGKGHPCTYPDASSC